MNSERSMAVVRIIYDEVHLALWGALTAFTIYFAVFVAPKLPELQAAAERHRISQIAAQDEAFCAKWHMGTASVRHDECLEDLQQLRAEIENRISADAEF